MVYSLIPDKKQGRYLFLKGGLCSEQTGCPAWGTSDPKKIRFIGDNLGTVILHCGKRTFNIPVVFGYTVWMQGICEENPAPFFGEFRDEELSAALGAALHVSGGLYVDVGNLEISEVEITDNPEKEGYAVYSDALRTDVLPESVHAVSLSDPFPEEVKSSIDRINYALLTYEEDYENAPERFEIPSKEGWKMHFTGTKTAEIATGVVYANMKNLCDRTDPDGFIHTSYHNAPSWRYDGFGPYVMNANSYYDSFYSRDGARAIMTLNSYGYVDLAAKGCEFGDKWAMYYPEQCLTLGGQPIPGHFSVIPNKPLIYSTVLSKIGVPALCDDPDAQGAWPTKYTRSRFGDECDNLGNQETDGHGLMMMAHYAVWCGKGKCREYVSDNWRYISELAGWIAWCFDNPELSFVKDDLLYGETEAAMNDYTLYANIPCMLGMYCFAEMAGCAGKMSESALWTSIADRLKSGILNGLSDKSGKGWNLEKQGFCHDPAVTFLSDIYGYDIADMPEEFISRSRYSYQKDIDNTTRHGWYGASGIGYNHSMITQNALLLDRTEDASKLMESLAKLCYAPRLPDPYMVPEGISADVSRGIIRRQGDLGNLVQLAEAMKCMLIAAGVSPYDGKILKIMPRLPRDWGLDLQNFRVQNTESYIDLKVNNPSDISLTVRGGLSPDQISVRFGPFPKDLRQAEVTFNGQKYKLETYISGDAAWSWLERKKQ